MYIGLVFLSHGFGEHLAWYNELANLFAANGFLAFGHDHLGKKYIKKLKFLNVITSCISCTC